METTQIKNCIDNCDAYTFSDEAREELHKIREDYENMELALKRISNAKPDRLDHSIDIETIRRAVKIATKALPKECK